VTAVTISDERRELLRFALANTTDPLYAARLADELGDHLVIDGYPQVGMPVAWVKRKRRGGVEIAAWALRYCHDEDTLRMAAFSDKRQRVREALAENSHLPDDAFAHLRSLATDEGHVEWANELDELAKWRGLGDDPAERLRQRIYHPELAPRDEDSLWGWTSDLEDLGDEAKSRELLGELLAWAVAGRDPLVLSELAIGAWLGVRSTGGVQGLLDGVDVLGAISGLDLGVREAVCREVLGAVGEYGGCAISREVAELMVRTLRSPVVTMLLNGAENRHWLSFEATQYLAGLAGWAEVIAVTAHLPGSVVEELVLSYEHGAGLIDGTVLLGRQRLSRSQVERILRVDSTRALETWRQVEAVLEVATGVDDPLVGVLVSRVTETLLVGYLTGEWRVSGRVCWPSATDGVAMVRGIVRSAPERGPGQTLLTHLSLVWVPEEYGRAVVDQVVGAAAELVNSPLYSSYIYGCLEETGVSMDVVLSQFAHAKTTTLDHLCGTLRRLGQVTGG